MSISRMQRCMLSALSRCRVVKFVSTGCDTEHVLATSNPNVIKPITRGLDLDSGASIAVGDRLARYNTSNFRDVTTFNICRARKQFRYLMSVHSPVSLLDAEFGSAEQFGQFGPVALY